MGEHLKYTNSWRCFFWFKTYSSLIDTWREITLFFKFSSSVTRIHPADKKNNMGVPKIGVVYPPKSSICSYGFPLFAPSILGVKSPYFWKHPYFKTTPQTFKQNSLMLRDFCEIYANQPNVSWSCRINNFCWKQKLHRVHLPGGLASCEKRGSEGLRWKGDPNLSWESSNLSKFTTSNLWMIPNLYLRNGWKSPNIH